MSVRYKLLIVLPTVLLLVCTTIYAQKKHNNRRGGTGTGFVEAAPPPPAILELVLQSPEFYGGATKYIQEHVNYPQAAKDNGVEGTVSVRFVIDEAGMVNDLHIARGVNSSLDQEAMRVIRSMPRWKNAKINGKSVRWPVILSVIFRLEQ